MSGLPGDRIPVRLPHFALREGALYFLASRRAAATLDATEQEIWRALDGVARVRDLTARFPAGAESALARLLDVGACRLVESGFPAGRRRVLVIEPHMDDAALSLGGTLWSRRAGCEFTIVSLAGRSNFTSYYYLDRDYFDVEAISAMRAAESALLARAVGGRHVALGLAEAPLRYQPGSWSLDWFRRHRESVSAFIGHPSGLAERREWTAAIRRALREWPADEVWAPIGVAPHTDHELTRNAFLDVLAEDPALVGRCIVRLYQEVPYAAQFPGFTDAIVAELTRCGARLEREAAPVTEVFPEKLRLLALFGSQFKLEALRPGIEAAARAAAGAAGGLAEVLYRVAAPPDRLDPVRLHLDAAGVTRLAERLEPWIRRHRDARRIRLFVRLPVGRWAEDVGRLMAVFPRARFEARVSAAALAEAQGAALPRVEVRRIGRGALAWALGALRAGFGGPAPTLMVAAADRMREAGRLRWLMPWSDTLVVPGLHHVALALELLAHRGGTGAAPPDPTGPDAAS